MLNAGEENNGNNSEFVQETALIDDFVPDTEPDENPLDFADSYGVGGNDTAYGGSGGGIGYRDVSGYDTPYTMQGVNVSATSNKKKMYIYLIIALAVVVMVFLSRKKSKKRR